ncbi:EAL domain-containing protein [Oribacterium sp. WCC10]|uniref:EAL domain-containing protein n=1 Tax=Oribacterium sp. WCC10 TaxID=1855343 RepID=UPI0008E0617B|nr:EAL domain-containing protein [Oribacterium sp. WCC10]SFG44566.1 EAL domain, c-di-GMP-specific phosphodiesterase class I (or its enzymatically inactive variant) [Oribacterium sp. WCC10]
MGKDFLMDTIIIEKIEKAIENKELKAFYQPQYDAITGRIVGAEALVRWIKDDGEVIMPDSFIPELEKTEAVNVLDWYMAEETCKTVSELRSQGVKISISSNFSRWHINEKCFVEKLTAIADRYQVPYKYLEVEITESALISESAKIIEWVKEIRKAGFSVAIDDFGSGLSSLQFVKDIPADVLKIDRSLLSSNCSSEKERIVLESIFYFAKRLNMQTIAEGVETQEQLGFLRTCSCNRIQGFLYARPMPKDKFFLCCLEKSNRLDAEDILSVQAPTSAAKLLMDAIFMRYPLVIFANLTRNSYYMMAYENFSTKSCPAAGVFDELIVHGAATMHPEDKAKFEATFNREALLKAYEEGRKSVSVVTRQLGDDGIYHEVESTDYFVKHASVDDVLVISLCDIKG